MKSIYNKLQQLHNTACEHLNKQITLIVRYSSAFITKSQIIWYESIRLVILIPFTVFVRTGLRWCLHTDQVYFMFSSSSTLYCVQVVPSAFLSFNAINSTWSNGKLLLCLRGRYGSCGKCPILFVSFTLDVFICWI